MRPGDSSRVLRFPYRGAPQTVSVIVRAARESQNHLPVRLLAERFCDDVRSKCYVSEILAVHHGLEALTRYMRDPRTIELVKAPYVLVQQIMAGMTPSIDCDEEAALRAALFLSIGCETRVATVAFKHMFYRGQRQYSHVFAQAKEPRSGAWITCDPVAGIDTDKMLRRVVAAKFWPVA